MKIIFHNLPEKKSESFDIKYGGVSFKYNDEIIHITFDKEGVALLREDGIFVKLDGKIRKESFKEKIWTDRLKAYFKGDK